MMKSRRRPNEDYLERRRREDESPRLQAMLPDLVGLHLQLRESRGEGQVDVAYTRHISVGTAPSLFMVPCGDPRCKHGSYDLTSSMLSGLRRKETQIAATDECRGEVGSAPCNRVLRCVAAAEYVV